MPLMGYHPQAVLNLADDYGWEHVSEKDNHNTGMLHFRKMLPYKGRHRKAVIEVWLWSRTVGTKLSHPKQGRTQLFRRDVSLDLLEKIFDNPRIHTDRGYRRRQAI